ncbi:SMI1/KNR4 family protein [Ruegeria arenilitoris]|uniref:SMI1/KNR4 family protein n=1 Tax=Ruegeria arenilitoris TaxID=1173585 RepID=UPI001481815A|nr:SMI1/KNR4 family protein [Ruegeria arenilitoris]
MSKLDSFEMIRPPKPTDSAAIKEIEERVGRHFPDAYKAFLLKYNNTKWQSLIYKEAKGKEQEVKSFFSINDPVKSCDLMENYITDTEAGNNLVNHLPIASSSFGDIVSISLNDDDYGSVWLRDDNLSFGNRGNMEAYSKVAGSFSAFIEMLYVDS